MIKARAGDHIFFGLSEINLQKLREGKAIKADLHTLGIEGTVIIYYGETEEAMKRELESLIGPGTQVQDLRPKGH